MISDMLRGADVIILSDNDTPGRDHAALAMLGTPTSEDPCEPADGRRRSGSHPSSVITLSRYKSVHTACPNDAPPHAGHLCDGNTLEEMT
jgi:hypothetical protein